MENNNKNGNLGGVELVSDSCNSNMTMKIGTRDSELAMKQTNLVVEKLKKKYPQMKFEIESMKTLGDKILDVALSKIGSKALFTKELEVALEKKHVDIVVHSLKDLPTTLPSGMVVGAVCTRENPKDAVIVHPKHKNCTLLSLPDGSVVGTSSLRRVAQLKKKFPHLQFESIRGNLNTRLKKLQDDNKYDAIVLAAAGVIRMGWKDKITQYLESEDCMYAVGQGALAVECREGDQHVLDTLSPLNDSETLFCVAAERSFMRHLEGGCSVPLGVHCEVKDDVLRLSGGVWSLDGSQELLDNISCSLNDVSEGEKKESEDDDDDSSAPPTKKSRKSAEDFCGIVGPPDCEANLRASYDLGANLANILLAKGAKKVLDEAKDANYQPANVPPPKKSRENDSKGDSNVVATKESASQIS